MRKSISVLPLGLKNRIAAGEVVERPSSVVKELVENSLDAGASKIEVFLENGGQGLIMVRDNGEGIPPDELPTALMRHATSKITSEEDLFNVLTMGFRGEALPSIGSVSKLTLTSCFKDSGEAFSVTATDQGPSELAPAALATGTVVQARDLFYNVPARRKFLKTNTTEVRRCREILFRISLSRPDVGFTFTVDGKEVFRLPQNQTLRARLGIFWAGSVVEGLVEFEAAMNGVKAHGLAGLPNRAQARGDKMLFYVGGRAVKDKLMIQAVRKGYAGKLLAKEYPVAVVFLDLPPEMVDVNVHPAKEEVRFQDESLIFSILRRGVVQALSRDPNQPLSGFKVHVPEKPVARPQTLPWQEDRPVASEAGGGPDSAGAPPEFPDNFPDSFPDSSSDPSMYAQAGPYPDQEPMGEQVCQPQPQSGYNGADQSPPPVDISYSRPAPPESGPQSPGIQSQGIQYLGQVESTYLVLKQGDQLLLLDQHAAHERVLFEKLRRAGNMGRSRVLALPLEISLHPSEAQALQADWEKFKSLGYQLEMRGQTGVRMIAVPENLEPGQARDFLREAVSGGAKSIEDMWTMMSCRMAIKGGETLAPDEALALLEVWQATPDKDYCPHGRPVTVKFSRSELEKMFKRKG